MLARLDLAEVSEPSVLKETSRTSFVNINTPDELESVSENVSNYC